MTTTPDTTTADRNLDAACTAVAAEIARSDSKASLLLAFTGAVLAGLATAADKDLPPLTKAVGAAAALVLGAAAVLLLLVVRPDLGRGGRTVSEGFPRWAALDEDALRTAMATDTRALRVKSLSALAVSKYRRLALAVNIILTALGLLLTSALTALA